MRIRMAAGAVVAATVLSLTGATVASANGKDVPPKRRESPVKLAACALGSALGSLTGGDDSCMRDRLARTRQAAMNEDRPLIYRNSPNRGHERNRGEYRDQYAGSARSDDSGREENLGRGETLPRL